jgi:5'-methylthioadenosine phosphorylase
MNLKPVIGIIGGTGLANIFDSGEHDITRFDTKCYGVVDVYIGEIAGETVYFVPRHGRFHEWLPHEANYLGNLVALKMSGVTDVIAVSAMGKLIAPESGVLPDDTHLAFPNQTIDRTYGRPNTIFGNGIAGHVARPWMDCKHLFNIVFGTAESVGTRNFGTGTLAVINGPQFSSKAESDALRHDGCHFVGMTSEPEARIARELGLCYTVIGQVTDLDNCGHHNVDQAGISARVKGCGRAAKNLIRFAIPRIVTANHLGECDCASAIHGSILTNRAGISHDAKRRICGIFNLDGDIPPHWFVAH